MYLKLNAFKDLPKISLNTNHNLINTGWYFHSVFLRYLYFVEMKYKDIIKELEVCRAIPSSVSHKWKYP